MLLTAEPSLQAPCSAFYVSVEDLNLGPHAYRTSTFTHCTICTVPEVIYLLINTYDLELGIAKGNLTPSL